jgi:predicted RNase H-like nuclease/cytidine deaminase
MSTSTFIGIDLAWKSQRNPTGAAVLRGDRAGADLEMLATLYPDSSVSEFVSDYATADTVVAIDAPLIIANETGQRSCETAIGRRYGSRDASCHTSNLTLYRDASSVALTSALLAEGFVHVDPTGAPEGRIIAEVFLHAAMVALWNLPKTIKYKKGSIDERRVGLEVLRTHLRQLKIAEPPLLRSGALADELAVDLDRLSGNNLKNYEDRLDALFCAYLAFYFWYWNWERNELFGDVQSGYILNPKLHPTGSTNTLPTAPLSTPADAQLTSQRDFSDIIAQAHKLARPISPSPDCSAGSVASVIISDSGKTYSGICLDFACGIGFCAEHAAVAEMLKAHESKISLVVAVDEAGHVLPPCGRCREMMWQLNPANRDALVVIAVDEAKTLSELLPFRS